MKKSYITYSAIDTFLGILTIIVTIAALFYLGIYLHGQEDCLEHGWKSIKVTWNLTVYCIREENEYEIVKPLKIILAEK